MDYGEITEKIADVMIAETINLNLVFNTYFWDAIYFLKF